MINLICFLLLESLLFYIFHLKINNINTCYQWARHTYPRTGVPYQDIHKSLGQFHTCLLCILLIHFCLFQYLRVSILSFLCINQEDQRSHIIESRWCNGVFLHFFYKKNLCSLANEQNKITRKWLAMLWSHRCTILFRHSPIKLLLYNLSVSKATHPMPFSISFAIKTMVFFPIQSDFWHSHWGTKMPTYTVLLHF